ncbi:hypothetical protein GTP81_03505 [Rugamonas sp. FT107W]|uniref:DUF2946 domain-containing protein n=1 Tax=Duganella vulcania TaxID=2692166 RepID=A0A845H9S2_9BURK|nr:hypothetical protein [Duganella vulcania]
MNIRRNFFYVLLSLLLVFSQQMGYSHALSHASAATGVVQAAQQDEDASRITKLGLDHNCAQCLAFAQIASAADTHFYSFPLAAGTSVAVVRTPVPLDCQRTVCGFRSRAPPVLS